MPEEKTLEELQTELGDIIGKIDESLEETQVQEYAKRLSEKEEILASIKVKVIKLATDSAELAEFTAVNGRKYFVYAKSDVKYDAVKIKEELPEEYANALAFSPKLAKDIPALNDYATITPTYVFTSTLPKVDDQQQSGGDRTS